MQRAMDFKRVGSSTYSLLTPVATDRIHLAGVLPISSLTCVVNDLRPSIFLVI